MKYSILALFLGILFLVPDLNGQIFEAYERDKIKKGKIDPKQRVTDASYVDINASLKLVFKQNNIEEQMQQFSGLGSNDSISRQLDQLEAILRNQNEIIIKLQAPIGEDMEALNQAAEVMFEYLDEVSKSPELSGLYNQYSGAYKQKYGTRSLRRVQAGTAEKPFREVYILNRFEEKRAELTQAVTASLDNSDVRFVLYGTLLSSGEPARPVKLSDDFDRLPEDIYVVPRWQTQLSSEDLQQLATIDSLSQSLNSLISNKGENFRKFLKEAFQADDCLDSLKIELEDLPQTLRALGQNADTQLNNLVSESTRDVDQLLQTYTKNQASSVNPNNLNLLQSFSGELGTTVTDITSFVDGAGNRLKLALDTLVSDPNIERIKGVYSGCLKKLQSDKQKIQSLAKNVIGLFTSAKQSTSTNDDIGPQVRRLSISNIPDTTLVDLINTGKRDNGDEIRIRAMLEYPNGGDTLRKTIQTLSFKVQQINMYSVIKPLLLLGNPTGSGENVNLDDSKFQFAPSYSILFKYGSRNSRAWNEVWQPAIGVNFGALDFDTEGTPEFTAALEFAFLKDYFSVGYGYNFGVSEPFFMLGFRLPVGAIPLPLFNDVQVRD